MGKDLLKLLNNKSLLIAIALISSYSFWVMIRQSHRGKLALTLPVYFYNIPEGQKITYSPKIIEIQLLGPRNFLSAINQHTSAAFVDAKSLPLGQSSFVLTKNNINLPLPVELEKKCCLEIQIQVESRTS